jgi:hypothetical protein
MMCIVNKLYVVGQYEQDGGYNIAFGNMCTYRKLDCNFPHLYVCVCVGGVCVCVCVCVCVKVISRRLISTQISNK